MTPAIHIDRKDYPSGELSLFKVAMDAAKRTDHTSRETTVVALWDFTPPQALAITQIIYHAYKEAFPACTLTAAQSKQKMHILEDASADPVAVCYSAVGRGFNIMLHNFSGLEIPSFKMQGLIHRYKKFFTQEGGALPIASDEQGQYFHPYPFKHREGRQLLDNTTLGLNMLGVLANAYGFPPKENIIYLDRGFVYPPSEPSSKNRPVRAQGSTNPTVLISPPLFDAIQLHEKSCGMPLP